MGRPNVDITQDGHRSSVFDRIDLSDHYLLHIHPRSRKEGKEWKTWDEEQLRKFDGVYGEAARIALFGSPDLIYKPGEEVHEMHKKFQISKYPPIVQKNAIVEDTDD